MPGLGAIAAEFESVEGASLVFDLLNGRNTALGVVKALCQRQEQLTFEQLERLQTLIIRLTGEAPFAHAAIIALLKEFYHCQNQEVYVGIWSTFGMNEGDLHNSLIHDHTRVAEYININSFEARLWGAMGREVEDYIGSHPIRSTARSIEKRVLDEEFQTVDAEVAAACLWIIHGSKTLWRLSKDGDLNSGGKDWRGELWTGPSGYGVERWELWRARFQDTADGQVDSVRAETRQLALTAVANMDAAQATVVE